MKKTLVAIAALAVVGAASAQSTVSLTGTVSYSYQRDLTAATANPVFAGSTSSAPTIATLTPAAARGFALTDANLKLTVVEDLGGGLKASADYLLETGAFRGSLATRADAGMALTGGFGGVSIRNTRSSDLIASIASPAISLPDGLYDSSSVVARGGIDILTYSLPTFIPGVSASISYSEGNDGSINLPTTAGVTKSSVILGLGYANGPVTVAGAFKSNNVNPGAATGVKKNQFELAASYDFGVAKVSYGFDSKQSTAATEKNAHGLSVTVPFGAVSVGAQVFKRGVNKQTEFGVTYALSKRTRMSASAGRQTADQTATIDGNQYRLKLNHNF